MCDRRAGGGEDKQLRRPHLAREDIARHAVEHGLADGLEQCVACARPRAGDIGVQRIAPPGGSLQTEGQSHRFARLKRL